MKNKLGVLQGRLVPKYHGRYQAFPIDYWKEEFKIAKEFKLDLIEFILDFNDADENPLLKDGGVEEIKLIIKTTGVSVQTICADYFMEAPLHSENYNIAIKSRKVLLNLLDKAKSLDVTNIVIPCVDQSSLKNHEAVERFVNNLTPAVKIAEKYGINLSLETDLAPQPFLELLERFNSSRVTVNYDIGNSAALGFDSEEELEAYGDRITDIHIKDRILGGGPVILGEGNADFAKFFEKLKEFNYQGPFIMQAYRDDEGVKIFKKQLNWVSSYLV